MAVDSQHVYWANYGTDTIGQANLDGSGVNQSFITATNGVVGVAVDRQHIYWANAYGGTIGRAYLDGCAPIRASSPAPAHRAGWR